MSKSHGLSSALGPTITSYLSLKKALGRRFDNESRILAHLDRFLAERTVDTSAALDPQSFAAWCLALEHLKPTVRRARMRIVRNLCLYLRRGAPDCFVPDPGGFPAPHPPLCPHIFTEAQVLRLLRVAGDRKATPTSPLRPEVLRLAIVLLYTAGLRRGELVRLVLSDYDPIEHTLLVRASKFHKSRLVALSDDAVRETDRYLRARHRLPHNTDAPIFTSCPSGLRAWSGGGIGHSLRRLFLLADVRTTNGDTPRVHDLRHTYAVHALLRWYRAGADIQAKLPVLSTAMGHVSIASTAYYLPFLEDLAQAACERFAHHYRANIETLHGVGGER